MKRKIGIKGIIGMTVIGISSLFFMNISLAANTGKVNVGTANLREAADSNAKILELLSVNQEVEVIEKTGDWYKVKVKGMTGYLRQDLITVSEQEKKNDSNSNDGTLNDSNQNQEGETTQQQEKQEDKTEQNQEVVQTEPTEQKDNSIELGKQKIAENTKLKIVPVINATDTIEVKKDEEVNVIEVVNGWVCVEVQTTKGWIRKEKIQKEEPKTEATVETTANPTQEQSQNAQQPEEQTVQPVSKTLYVNTPTVRLRKEASTSSEIITTVSINTAVEVIAESDGWSKVKVNGKEGYISSSLLATTKQETSRGASTPRKDEMATTEPKQEEKTKTSTSSGAPSGKGSTVLATAQQYIGCKYVYGGSSPSGFDCSGFTSYVYKAHGVSLSRTAAGQYSNGVAVNRSDLKPGDLVMFGKSGINHVAIYAGGGKIVHAANPSRGVTTDTINSGYYNKNYVGARRVMP